MFSVILGFSYCCLILFFSYSASLIDFPLLSFPNSSKYECFHILVTLFGNSGQVFLVLSSLHVLFKLDVFWVPSVYDFFFSHHLLITSNIHKLPYWWTISDSHQLLGLIIDWSLVVSLHIYKLLNICVTSTKTVLVGKKRHLFVFTPPFYTNVTYSSVYMFYMQKAMHVLDLVIWS